MLHIPVFESSVTVEISSPKPPLQTLWNLYERKKEKTQRQKGNELRGTSNK